MQSIADILAENVLRMRSKARLSREELAERAGLSTFSVMSIESKRRWPKPDTLKLLARGLGVPEQELFQATKSGPIYLQKAIERVRQALVMVEAIERLPSARPIEAILDALSPGWREGSVIDRE